MITNTMRWWAGGMAALVLLSGACGGGKSTSFTPSTPAPSPTPSPSELLAEQAAPLCSAAFKGTAPTATAKPQAPLLAVQQLDESEVEAKFQDPPSSLHVWRGARYQYELGVPDALAAKSGDAAQTLVCVTERQVQVGTYQASGSGAVRVDFDVHVLRRSDGAMLAHRRFAGSDPPNSRTTTRGAGYTVEYGPHPTSAVVTWLQQLVAP